MYTYEFGVDEAGRGPLAGPVAVGAVCIPRKFDWQLIPHVHDSKKLSSKKREEIFMQAQSLQRQGVLDFRVSMVSAPVIDRIGISSAVSCGVTRTTRTLLRAHLLTPEEVEVKLDGLLHAPSEFVNQKTIIKGDSLEKSIGLASILAKVTRDRYMCRQARRFPQYGFEVHKGYGTHAHTTNIRDHGLSTLHRRTFCRKLIK